MEYDSTKMSFGFQRVSPEEKTQKVKEVFQGVAEKYDLMNDIMSLGLHRLWKKRFVSSLPLQGVPHVLDMACGTGDISYGISKRNPKANIILADINESMLAVGQKKHLSSPLAQRPWICADATQLPFEDFTFDLYVISFGIRNVTGLDAALKEAYRVLKPGGCFACLEFSHVPFPLLKKVYEIYAFHLIPKYGEWILGAADPYQYLVESIAQFPTQEAFKERLVKAGFEKIIYQNLNFGVAAIHKGWRL